MYIHVEEKRAWMRPSTHTLVLDRDPDFENFERAGDGTVFRWLRFWLADAPGQQPDLKAYLGCIGLCPGLPTKDELMPVFRRASLNAELAGAPGRQLRQQLASAIRSRTPVLRRSIRYPRQDTPAHLSCAAQHVLRSQPLRQPAGSVRRLFRRLFSSRRFAAACVASGLCAILGSGCTTPVKELEFAYLPPRVPEMPRLLAPTLERASATVRTDVEVQDWWLEGWQPLPKARVAILSSGGPGADAVAGTAATRLGLLLQRREFRIVDRELEERLAVQRSSTTQTDVWLIVAVNVNAVDRQQVELSSIYDLADRQRYEREYTQYRRKALEYLDRVDHEYIVQLKAVSNTDSPVLRGQVQRLMRDLDVVREDVRADSSAEDETATAGPRPRRRAPQIALPIEPYSSAERRGAGEQPVRSAPESAKPASKRPQSSGYDPLADYSLEDLPIAPPVLDAAIKERSEYMTKSFSVQVSQVELAVRAVEGATGKVVGLGIYRCTDTSVGRAVQRMAQTCAERFSRP